MGSEVVRCSDQDGQYSLELDYVRDALLSFSAHTVENEFK